MSRAITVENCEDCPGLYQHSEYPESLCKFAKGEKNLWPRGHYQSGQPAPARCPIRKKGITLRLGSLRTKKCGAELHYEHHGFQRVYRMRDGKKRFYYRCPDCGDEGENNGRRTYCNKPVKREQ